MMLNELLNKLNEEDFEFEDIEAEAPREPKPREDIPHEEDESEIKENIFYALMDMIEPKIRKLIRNIYDNEGFDEEFLECLEAESESSYAVFNANFDRWKDIADQTFSAIESRIELTLENMEAEDIVEDI